MTIDDTEPEDGDGAPRIFAEERKRRILDLVAQRGRVRGRDLAELVGVTETTIRKDIIDLDKAGLLRRTHGGALAITPAYEPHVDTRIARNAAAKSRIARACLAEVHDGDAIYLDSGTTIGAIATLLTRADTEVDQRLPRDVNVLTNAIDVARALENVPTTRPTVLGGQFRSLGGCFVGPLAVSSAQEFTLNTAFIGVSGLTETGITVSDIAEAQLKNAIMDQARRVVVALDQSKVGATDFARVCALDRIDVIVTDVHDDYLADLCAREGITLVVAAP